MMLTLGRQREPQGHQWDSSTEGGLLILILILILFLREVVNTVEVKEEDGFEGKSLKTWLIIIPRSG